MNFLETLSTFQQMTLFAAIIIVWAVAMTVGAVIVAHRQNWTGQTSVDIHEPPCA